jgi:beta-lactamase regulating signal transducer with metallopeptidase domain
MTEALIDHLWQSTLCAGAAALLTLAFRRNGARVRHLIWFAAAAKFLIPFSLLFWAGAQLRGLLPPLGEDAAGLPAVLEQIAQPGVVVTSNLAETPLARAVSDPGWSIWAVVLAVWLAGTLLIIGRRIYEWLYLRAVVEAASAVDIEAPLPVLETQSELEPGIFGVIAPTLLLPAGITTRLPPEQLRAIIDHELCHLERKDNLTAAIQMVVEALFWFHPMVWWIGSRLIVERERACDEAVVESGRDRHTYAEGILMVCRHYVEPPRCSASVSGGSLRKRIEAIMTAPLLNRLSFAKKCALVAAAFGFVAGPLAVGAGSSPALTHAAGTAALETKHYRSDEWGFQLDVPQSWVVMPPVSSNSPGEVIRFLSREEGNHNLIVFRSPFDPKQRLEVVVRKTQDVLAKGGFSNFVVGETTIGSRRVPTLEFSKLAPDGVTVWSCRHYFIADGPVGYILGFGTTDRDKMFDRYERIAQTFSFENR